MQNLGASRGEWTGMTEGMFSHLSTVSSDDIVA